MQNEEYTLQELETILKSFAILSKHQTNFRESLTTVEAKIKELYVSLSVNKLLQEFGEDNNK